ncbi:MAG TPA: phosphate acyltransferase PlsX [Gemmatimonadaceae bacterium]|nr:phosphate acyltransferase PlsX [Gemmatimonadaceae bacterium]
MARIALDAMGGDHAPHATIAGALLALGELDAAHSLQLVGRTEDIERELAAQLAQNQAPRKRLTVIDAPQVVEMSDKPAAVLRAKSNSSMAVGLKLQAAGESDAFVSAGNTGAQMAASTLILKLHDGLTRPAIGTVFPTVNHPVVVLDAGANVDCTSEELVQFARLGATYAEDILGRSNPSVGLLSIGEEAEKGNAAVKEAHQMLLESDLNFQGNVEGRDILTGATDRGPIDVVVCDGFVGNVLLKFYESVPPMILALLARSGIDPVQLRRAFSKEFDYSEHGGAPLLGVRGVSIISHGKSSPNAIKNAILVALRAVESRMTEHIGRRLSQTGKETA